jgi:hypothetical protein
VENIIMPDIPQEITTPPLHPVWSTAKKAAEAKAKELKEEKKYAELDKKMNKSLGPDLDSWPKDYPKLEKLKSNKTKIDTTIKSYSDFVKAAALNANVKKPMTDALVKIQKAMDDRLKEAEAWIQSDTAIKESEKMAKHDLRPLKIIAQDVAAQVNAKAGDTKIELTKYWLDVVISDVKVLEKVPTGTDNPALAKKIREQANFPLLIDQLAGLLKQASNDIKTEKDFPAAEKKFREGADKFVEAATIRGAKPIADLAKVKTDNIKYVVTQTVTLTLKVGAVVVGAVALAGTPFTGGVSTIAGIIVIVNQGIQIADQVAKLAMDEQQLIDLVAKELAILQKGYTNAKAAGALELASTAVKATLGIPVPSIDECKKNVKQVHDKINLLEEQNNKQAVHLGKLLTQQEKLTKQMKDFETGDLTKLEPAEKQQYEKVKKALGKSPELVTALIKKTNDLSDRIEKAETSCKLLEGPIQQLSGNVPTWALIGQIVINAGVAAGFLVAGNVNVPDPFKCWDMAVKVSTDLGNVIGSLQAAKDAGEGLKTLYEKHAKK